MKKFEVNGMLVADRLLREHGVIGADEVWVHGMWTPGKWAQCIGAKLRGKKLVRMTHGSLSPIYLERQGKWKKRLVGPIEKLLYRMADKIVFTGEWEAEWFEKWMPGQERKFEIVDLKRFFKLGFETHGEVLTQVPDGTRKIRPDLNAYAPPAAQSDGISASGLVVSPLRVLYLGRNHPLKGVKYLEKAVEELDVELRIVSNHFGEELEKDWEWCDVLCLPTLSENFGLVVAEALERGKSVITTDGAPAFAPDGATAGKPAQPRIVKGYEGRLLYLEGFRDGSEEERVNLLKAALKYFV